jgi:hypothetical protein
MKIKLTFCVLAAATIVYGCTRQPPPASLEDGPEREIVEDRLGEPIERLEVSSYMVDVYSHHEARPYYRDCYGFCASGNALMHLFQELLDPVYKTYVVTYDHGDRVIAYAALESEEVWVEHKTHLSQANAGNIESQYRVSTFRWLPDEMNVSWLCKAANGGHPRAPFELGRIHYYGLETTQKDYVEAYAWYGFARTNGYDEPSDPSGGKIKTETGWRCCYPHPALESIAAKLTPSQLIEAERLVAEWEPNLAECEAIGPQDQN